MDSTGLVKRTFLLHEVVVLSGFSKYMLDYLAREDIFRPTLNGPRVRGRRRQYTYEDLVLLRALHSICVGKGKIRHLRESLRNLRTEIGPLEPGQKLERLLLVEGDELCLRTGHEGAQELRSGQLTFAFVVDLRAVSAHLASMVHTNSSTGKVSLESAAAAQAEAERQRIWKPMQARRGAGAR